MWSRSRSALGHLVALSKTAPHLLSADLSFFLHDPNPVAGVPVGPPPAVPEHARALIFLSRQSNTSRWLDEDWLGSHDTATQWPFAAGLRHASTMRTEDPRTGQMAIRATRESPANVEPDDLQSVGEVRMSPLATDLTTKSAGRSETGQRFREHGLHVFTEIGIIPGGLPRFNPIGPHVLCDGAPSGSSFRVARRRLAHSRTNWRAASSRSAGSAPACRA